MSGRGWPLLALVASIWLSLAASVTAAPQVPASDPTHQVLVLVQLPAAHYRPNDAYSGGYGDPLSRGALRRAAERVARAHGLTVVDDWPMPLLSLDCFIMAVPADQSPEVVAERLSRDPGVAWSQPMHVYRARGKSVSQSDPLYPAQPAGRLWRLAELHRVATGRNVSVAVIDSQVEAAHPDLAGQVTLEENFVGGRAPAGELHGTGVAGIIAARADNGVGIAGVAPDARLLALRACWQVSESSGPATLCSSLSLAKALHFAIDHKAQVVNLSLSGPPDPLLAKLLDIALAKGATVVGAYDPDLPHGGFPASHPGVIAVSDESLASYPAGVYIAPGLDVPTTQPGGRWFLVSGSSYAAAHVSGLAALVRERRRLEPGPLRLISDKATGGVVAACSTLLPWTRACDCCRISAAKPAPVRR
jgi:hypothetical protein